MNVELSLSNVRYESNVYLKGDVKSNTVAILKFSVGASYYDTYRDFQMNAI